jgi:hypothetical protein
MATFNFTQYTKQAGAVNTRSSRPSALPMQSIMRRLTLSYTCTGAELTGDKFRVAFPHMANCKLIPELSRVTNPTGGASFIGDVKLQKVNTAGTEVDLTAAAAISNNSVAFARITDGSLPAIGHDDYIQFLLSGTVTAAANQVVILELALECPEAV